MLIQQKCSKNEGVPKIAQSRGQIKMHQATTIAGAGLTAWSLGIASNRKGVGIVDFSCFSGFWVSVVCWVMFSMDFSHFHLATNSPALESQDDHLPRRQEG